MTLNRWQCWLKSIWYSFEVGWPFNYPCSGHDYQEQHDGSLKCIVCGKQS